MQTKPSDNTDATVSALPKAVPVDIGIKPCMPAITALSTFDKGLSLLTPNDVTTSDITKLCVIV